MAGERLRDTENPQSVQENPALATSSELGMRTLMERVLSRKEILGGVILEFYSGRLLWIFET